MLGGREEGIWGGGVGEGFVAGRRTVAGRGDGGRGVWGRGVGWKRRLGPRAAAGQRGRAEARFRHGGREWQGEGGWAVVVAEEAVELELGGSVR